MTEPEPAKPVRAILRDFLAFVRRPQVLVPCGLRAPGAWRAWGVLTALQVGVLVALVLPLISAWHSAFGLPTPDAFGQVPKQWLVPTVVLIAPLIEELLFRGWQTGRPRALWLAVVAALTLAVLLGGTQLLGPLGTGMAVLAALPVGLIGWLALRKHAEAPTWFTRAFPAIFHLVVIGFALAHLTNYPSVSLLAVPMVLPQAWGALVLGYVRQRIGLPASILAHATANALSLSLAMVTGG